MSSISKITYQFTSDFATDYNGEQVNLANCYDWAVAEAAKLFPGVDMSDNYFNIEVGSEWITVILQQENVD